MKKSISRVAPEQYFYKHYNHEQALNLKIGSDSEIWIDLVKGTAAYLVGPKDLSKVSLGHMKRVPGEYIAMLARKICKLLSVPNLDFISKADHMKIEMQISKSCIEITGCAIHRQENPLRSDSLTFYVMPGVEDNTYRYSVYKVGCTGKPSQISFGKLTVSCEIETGPNYLSFDRCFENSGPRYFRSPVKQNWQELEKKSIYPGILPHNLKWALIDRMVVCKEVGIALSYAKLSGFNNMKFSEVLTMTASELLNQTGAALVIKLINQAPGKKLILARNDLCFLNFNPEELGRELTCKVIYLDSTGNCHRFYGAVGAIGPKGIFYPICYGFVEGIGD